MSNRSETATRWRGLLRRQAHSGLSVAAFCRRSRISQASFYYWRRRVQESSGFTEVCVAPEPTPNAGALEVVLSGGRRIVVEPGFDRPTLLALVEALEQGTAAGGDQDRGA